MTRRCALDRLTPLVALLALGACSDATLTWSDPPASGGAAVTTRGGAAGAGATTQGGVSGESHGGAGASAGLAGSAGDLGSSGGPPAAAGGGSGDAGSGGSSSTPRKRGKHEPAAGKTLLLVGQDTQEIEAYAQAFGYPAGVMLYSNVWDGLGVLSASDFGGFGTSDAQYWASHAQPLALQVGLDLDARLGCGSCGSCRRAGHLEALAAGAAAELSVVAGLATRFKHSGRPVFLRVGYEFDAEICPGGFGKYPTQAYRKAFAQVVRVMREAGADNVAFVWNAWAFQAKDPASTAGASPWAWYPGDELVDWIGLSVFPGVSPEDPSERAQANKRRQMVQFAAAHGKPLMIAESTPRARFAPALGQGAWAGWYEELLRYVEDNDVKALSYINMNWEALPAWHGQGWGDTRLQGGPLSERWREVLAGERFLISSPTLFEQMGFVRP